VGASVSLSDDLALVTACRDAIAKATPGPWHWGRENLGYEQPWLKAPLTEDDPPFYVVWVENLDPDRDQFDHVSPAVTGDGPRSAENAALIAGAPTVYGAALSLIEDTLNDHAPTEANKRWCSRCDWSLHTLGMLACPTYSHHLAALHTIATALGVEVPA
jgi:hypothetical protein